VVPLSQERTETITLTGKQSFSNTMSVNNLANGSVGSGQSVNKAAEVESSNAGDEALAPINGAICNSEENELPLVGDYVGMGGPDAVPLETQGAFEKPDGAGNLLDELFMSPTETQLLSVRRAFTNLEIAKNKGRLKWCIFFHYLLSVVMALKLLPELLDKLDIFVLEIEELLVPKPMPWEWIWMTSVLPTIAAFSACRRSKISHIKIFQYLIVATGLLPIIAGMSYHFSDISELILGNGDGIITSWQGIPIAILWYVFFFTAIQIHGLQFYLANTLILAWQPKKSN